MADMCVRENFRLIELKDCFMPSNVDAVVVVIAALAVAFVVVVTAANE